jgi:uncharacterized protein YcfL
MGNTTFKGRKATFTSTTTKQGRVFTPINRRAHIVVRKLGKRTKVTVADLKASKNAGTYRFYCYDAQGVLKPVRF